MTRPLRLSPLVLLVGLFLLLPRSAWAKYDPPPLPRGGGVVTTGGWLAPYDIRKYNEELDTIRVETGYEIDVLLVGSLEGTTIDEVASTTYQTWKPGEAGKDNGILLVVAPNFPKDERKARIVAGKGVTQLTEVRARQILQEVIAPQIKVDNVRAGIAAGIAAIGYAVGSVHLVDDAGLMVIEPTDGGILRFAGSDAGVAAVPSAAPGAPTAKGDAGPGMSFLYAVGGFLVLALAYVGFMRIRGAKAGD